VVQLAQRSYPTLLQLMLSASSTLERVSRNTQYLYRLPPQSRRRSARSLWHRSFPLRSSYLPACIL